MKRANKSRIIVGVIGLVIFVFYTWLLTIIDQKPIGPNNSYVGFASVNKAAHSFFGVNMILYDITDWAGIAVILVAFSFAIIGLIQWIKRKNILKVDICIILLGIYYICVFGVYLLFEFVPINYRPVLINGYLETSYPSSTTMLAMCVMPSAAIELDRLIHRRNFKKILIGLCYGFEGFMVVGRVLSGVHWITDILGGAIFSISILLIFSGLHKHLLTKQKAR